MEICEHPSTHVSTQTTPCEYPEYPRVSMQSTWWEGIRMASAGIRMSTRSTPCEYPEHHTCAPSLPGVSTQVLVAGH